MRRQFLWLTIGGTTDDAAFTGAAMASLLRRLDAEVPGLNLRGAELHGPLLDELLPELHAGNLNRARDVVRASWGSVGGGDRLHVTAYCPDPNHPAARAARGRLRHAMWGISLGGAVSLTYAPRNPYALWHESLHLLGAEDHYERPSFRTTCQTRTCLMQYAPDETTIGPGPLLCPETTATLRSACA